MAIVYRSKIDVWLLVTLGVSAAISLVAAAAVVYFVASPAGWAVAVFTAAIGAGLPFWLLVSTYYMIGPGHLLVRCGPFKCSVPHAEITSITPTRNPLSSPALSLDRLRIDYGHGKSLMISPRGKEQFLRDIEAVRNGAA